MPDSFSLPPWGSQPFDERDLDSLLAGKTDVPVALRPVAETLSALAAAPSRAELRDEAFVRVQFSQLSAGLGARTLEMPTVPRQRRRGGRHGTARPHPHQRPRGWGAGLLAAAAVIAGGTAVAYTGNLPGPVQRIAHETIAAPSAERDEPGGGSSAVQAKSAQPAPTRPRPATSDVLSSAAPSPSAPSRTALCEAFWSAMQHPRPGPSAWWQTPLYRQLSEAAGGPRRVYAYCSPVWEHQSRQRYPRVSTYPPYFPHQQDYGDAPGQYQGQEQNQYQGQGQGQEQDQEQQYQQGPDEQAPGGTGEMSRGMP